MILTAEMVKWAEGIADNVARHLPPQFDPHELRAAATLACWRASQQYDPARGVPFEAFAYRRVHGAAYDSSRYRKWRITAEVPLEVRDDEAVDGHLVEDIHRVRMFDEAWEIIQMLDRRKQRLAKLLWREGCSVSLAARKMRIPRSKAYYWKRVMVMSIRAEMAERGLEG